MGKTFLLIGICILVLALGASGYNNFKIIGETQSIPWGGVTGVISNLIMMLLLLVAIIILTRKGKTLSTPQGMTPID